MKINIIVVDDDRAITEKLKQIVAEWPEYYQHTISIKTENSLSNISAATVAPYDLVILDVLIGENNGIKFAKTLRDAGSVATIAFISDHSRFALEGYSAHAISYIMKPLDKQKVFSLLDETTKRLGDYNSKTISFSIGTNYKFISTRSIIYICSSGRHVEVKFAHKTEDFVTPISVVEAQLPGTSLIRCHKSYIININYVRGFSSGFIELENISERIPVGRKYAEEVKKKLLSKGAEQL